MEVARDLQIICARITGKATETRLNAAFWERELDAFEKVLPSLNAYLAARGAEAGEPETLGEPFQPATIVLDEAGITVCAFEDVAYVAKPLHPGVYHFIDELRAMDDDRLVGIQFWTGKSPDQSTLPATGAGVWRPKVRWDKGYCCVGAMTIGYIRRSPLDGRMWEWQVFSYVRSNCSGIAPDESSARSAVEAAAIETLTRE